MNVPKDSKMAYRRDAWTTTQNAWKQVDPRVRRARKQNYRQHRLTIFDNQTSLRNGSITPKPVRVEQRTNTASSWSRESPTSYGTENLPFRPALRNSEGKARVQRPVNRPVIHPNSTNQESQSQGSKYPEPKRQQSNYERRGHEPWRSQDHTHSATPLTSKQQVNLPKTNFPKSQVLGSTATVPPMPYIFGSIYSQNMPSWDNLNYYNNLNSSYCPAHASVSQHSTYDQGIRQWSNPQVPISYQNPHLTNQAQLSYIMNHSLNQESTRIQPPSIRDVPGTWHQASVPNGRQQIPGLDIKQQLVSSGTDTQLPNKDHKLSVPIPSDIYLANSEISGTNNQPVRPKRLLVIIDLNGTLLLRTNRKAAFQPRRNLHKFVEYILENHTLMIWSSSKPSNVNGMVGNFLSASQKNRLLAIWARDTLRLSEKQFQNKVQVYKQLTWVWESELARQKATSGVVWDQTNTVLIDDSKLKAAAEPYNLLEVPEFKGGQEENDVLGQVLGYVKWLSLQANVSNAIRTKPFKADNSWGWTWN
jgi:NLI interacting factor-like phosphatase